MGIPIRCRPLLHSRAFLTIPQHTGEHMTQRYKAFSFYLLLKQTNPSAYYTAKTMKEMFLSCQNLGDAFFDNLRRAA